MENFQTLCIACHAKVTAEQHRRRTSEKLKLKKSLQRTIKKLQEQAERNKRRRTFYIEVKKLHYLQYEFSLWVESAYDCEVFKFKSYYL